VSDILAVAFDCYGTLIDFGDASFVDAYGVICAEQGIAIDGQTFYDKWMEVWRRLANDGKSSDTAAVAGIASSVRNNPGPLSEAEPAVAHPAHHTPSAGRNRSLDGPLPEFRPYRDEWPEQFAICFEELGVSGDAFLAHDRLREMIAHGAAFPETRRIVAEVSRKLPTACLSNADDDFLIPALSFNGLAFPTIVSSETAQAYKPHAAIFRALSSMVGLPAENILYVGDSRLADVVGAKNAGLQVAWVNRSGATSSLNGHTAEPHLQPDFVVRTLEGLHGILNLR
jgi:HAD superfamily hydrolase (TIGR01549 family)